MFMLKFNYTGAAQKQSRLLKIMFPSYSHLEQVHAST